MTDLIERKLHRLAGKLSGGLSRPGQQRGGLGAWIELRQQAPPDTPPTPASSAASVQFFRALPR